jgi:hypothetical protein
MNDRILITAVIALFSTIIGVIFWVSKSRAKMVFKDVCEEKAGRLNDCIENEVRSSKERYENLVKKVDMGFKELKQELKNNRG